MHGVVALKRGKTREARFYFFYVETLDSKKNHGPFTAFTLGLNSFAYALSVDFGFLPPLRGGAAPALAAVALAASTSVGSTLSSSRGIPAAVHERKGGIIRKLGRKGFSCFYSRVLSLRIRLVKRLTSTCTLHVSGRASEMQVHAAAARVFLTFVRLAVEVGDRRQCLRRQRLRRLLASAAFARTHITQTQERSTWRGNQCTE
jgi:hypothetical protein